MQIYRFFEKKVFLNKNVSIKFNKLIIALMFVVSLVASASAEPVSTPSGVVQKKDTPSVFSITKSLIHPNHPITYYISE